MAKNGVFVQALFRSFQINLINNIWDIILITIRPEQMAMFSNQALDRFRERAVKHVNRCWTKESERLGADKLPTQIDDYIAMAMSHELRSERDVILFIDLIFLLDYHKNVSLNTPWIVEAFARDDITPSIRLRLIWRQLTQEIREFAKTVSAQQEREDVI